MRIGLVPISAKPYHAGHHALVTAASRDNDAVILFVSLSDRKRKGEFPIHGKDMEVVWRDYLEPIVPSNVDIVYGGSPVQKVYQTLQDACDSESGDVYTVYSDPSDTSTNYPIKNREKYFSKLCKAGSVLFAAESNPRMFTRGVGTPDISGTSVRDMLRRKDFESFASAMPPGADARGIFDLLSRGAATLPESILRNYISHIILASFK